MAESKCFTCDGTGEMCDCCGESTAVCECRDDGILTTTCPACKGSGVFVPSENATKKKPKSKD